MAWWALVIVEVNYGSIVTVTSIRAWKAISGFCFHLLWIVSAFEAWCWGDWRGWTNVTLRTRSCYTVVLNAEITGGTVDTLINLLCSCRRGIFSFWTSYWQWCATRTVMTKFAFVFWIIRGGWAIIAPETSTTKTLNDSLRAPLSIWTCCAAASVREFFEGRVSIRAIWALSRFNWAKGAVARIALNRVNSCAWTVITCRTDLALERTLSSLEISWLTWSGCSGALRAVVTGWALVTFTSGVSKRIWLLRAGNAIVTCIASFVFLFERVITHSVFIAVVTTLTRDACSLSNQWIVSAWGTWNWSICTLRTHISFWTWALNSRANNMDVLSWSTFNCRSDRAVSSSVTKPSGVLSPISRAILSESTRNAIVLLSNINKGTVRACSAWHFCIGYSRWICRTIIASGTRVGS